MSDSLNTDDPNLGGKPSENPSSRRRLWAVLLVLDTILVCVFGGALVGMLVLNGGFSDLLKGFFQAPAPVRAVPRHNGQPKPAIPTPPSAPVPPPAPAPAPAPPASASTVESQLQEPKKARPVEFVCSAKKAKRVYLKGAFLHSGKRRMRKNSDGSWRLTVYLTPETYKYYCSVNGKDSEPMTMDVAP